MIAKSTFPHISNVSKLLRIKFNEGTDITFNSIVNFKIKELYVYFIGLILFLITFEPVAKLNQYIVQINNYTNSLPDLYLGAIKTIAIIGTIGLIVWAAKVVFILLVLSASILLITPVILITSLIDLILFLFKLSNKILTASIIAYGKYFGRKLWVFSFWLSSINLGRFIPRRPKKDYGYYYN